MKEFQFKKPGKDKDPEIISEDPRITNNSEIIKLSLKIGFVQLMCGLGGIAAAACILNGIASLFELEMFTHFNYKCGIEAKNLSIYLKEGDKSLCTRSLLGSLKEAGWWCFVGAAIIGSAVTQGGKDARRMEWDKKLLIKKLTKNISN
jgi:hypothetical protein|tara:strand:+ start:724 stop:1167 length:444 start_codon:yes stop_codon:yes gene_type:complete